MDAQLPANTSILTRPLSQHINHASPLSPNPPRPFSSQSALLSKQPAYGDAFLRRREGREDPARQDLERQRVNEGVHRHGQRTYEMDSHHPMDRYNGGMSMAGRRQYEEALAREDEERKIHRGYGGPGEWAGRMSLEASPSASTLPPPPPPPPPSAPPLPHHTSSTAFPPSLYPPTNLEGPSRSISHRSSSPRMYSGPPSQTATLPPPPPPFSTSNILGPASPPYTAHPPISIPRDSTMTSSISSIGRDVPTPSTKSSMSISSMLGSEPVKSREPSNAQPINGTSYSLPPSIHNSNASSPTKPTYSNGLQYSTSSRDQNLLPASVNRFRTNSGGQAALGKYATTSNSPVHSKFRSSTDFQPQISPRSEQNGPLDWRMRQERRSDPERLMQRSASQPEPPSSPTDDVVAIKRAQDRYNNGIAELEGGLRKNAEQTPHKTRAPKQSRSRKNTSSSAVSQAGASNDRAQSSNYPFLQSKTITPANAPTARPPIESATPSEAKRTSIHKGPFGPEALQRIRDDRLGAAPPVQQKSVPPESRSNLLDVLDDKRDSNSPKYNATILAMERSESFDKAMQIVRKGENGHRNSLALALENDRRHGRLSPNPQAVQGAQSRSDGPSRDPSIKNEFSRMFAGIGSGVSSSGLAGSGTSTPAFPPSPKQTEERLPRDIRLDLETTRSRTASRVGAKKSKRAIDENGERAASVRPDGERGTKRMRHHHHAPGHHHHHHRHLDDQSSTPVRVIGDPIATNHHHHHHQDGTIHYHTHNQAKATPASTSLAPAKSNTPSAYRAPKTTVNNAALLRGIAHLPRQHLGSILYSPFPSPLTDTLASVSAGKLNCHITVRIPSFYLTAEILTSTARSQALWGTEVYTDDSDPLAAAMHSGWLANPLDPSTQDSTPQPTDSTPESWDQIPSQPIQIPEGMDVHLTILTLPPLQQYAETIAHGVKSRKWGRDHDGISFMIVGMRSSLKSDTVERGLKSKRERVARGVKMGKGAGGCGMEVKFQGLKLGLGTSEKGKEVAAVA